MLAPHSSGVPLTSLGLHRLKNITWAAALAALLLCAAIAAEPVATAGASPGIQKLTVSTPVATSSAIRIRSDDTWFSLVLEVDDAAAIANSIWFNGPQSSFTKARQAEIEKAEGELRDAKSLPASPAAAKKVSDAEERLKKAAEPIKQRRLVLRMDGVPVPLARLSHCSYADRKLYFEIAELPPALKFGPTRELNLSLDYDDEFGRTPVARGARIRLLVVDHVGDYYAWMWGMEITLLILFLGIRTNLLRDADPKRRTNPASIPAMIFSTGSQLLPFSLARCQMAFWTVLVAWSWLYLWLATSQVVPLTDSVLAVMGIAGGTLLFARTVDRGKHALAAEVARKIAAQEDYVQTLIDRTRKTPAPDPLGVQAATDLPGATATLAALEAQHAQMLAGTARSRGLFTDLLSDDNGISIQRLQMLIWTLVLGVYFVRTTLGGLTMPDLDKSLLALMGISSGLYVGFKLPE